MYINKKLSIVEILTESWRVQLIILVVVSVATISYITFLGEYLLLSPVMITVLGTAISFFIGFINAQAYGRWWESRKIWGALVNDSRSFCRMALTFMEKDGDSDDEFIAFKKHLLYRHLAFLILLRDRLRDQNTGEELKYLNEQDKKELENQSHKANVILTLQGKDLNTAEKSKYLDVIRMAQINEMFNRFSDSMGKSERIKLTVFPVYYSTLISLSIWLYMLIFPMQISTVVGYWSIPLSYLVGNIFILTYFAGQSLLNPFEQKPSGIPISSITRTIEINTLEQIGEADNLSPLKPIDDSYII
jgi:putative membrane protein